MADGFWKNQLLCKQNINNVIGTLHAMRFDWTWKIYKMRHIKKCKITVPFLSKKFAMVSNNFSNYLRHAVAQMQLLKSHKLSL